MNKEAIPERNLDPQIQAFVSFLQDRSAAYPPLDTLSYPEIRRIVEEVRQPLTDGGPVLGDTQEHRLKANGRLLQIRVFNSSPGNNRPALIFLHGGGWVMFSLRTHDRVMRELAAQADIAVIGVEYSLSPDVRFPTQLEEIRAVIDWLFEKGCATGIDTNRLAIGGDSAGANLAMATCLRLRDEDRLEHICGMLLCYGVYDGKFDTDSYYRYADPAFNLSRDEMIRFWQCYVRSPEEFDNPLASPLRGDLSKLPPAFMVIAECDVLYDENIRMADKLQACGVDVTSKVYPGTTHSFLEAVSMAKVSEQAFSDASGWLRSKLNSHS